MKKKYKKCCVCKQKMFASKIENLHGFHCCYDCKNLIESEFFSQLADGFTFDNPDNLFKFLGGIYYDATHEYVSPYPDDY